MGYPSIHCRWYPSMPCGGYPSMHCNWYPSMPCSRGYAIPACLAAGGGACSQGVCSRGVCCCCGRYASYWNAFLLLLSFGPGTNRGNNSTCWGFFEMPQVPFTFDFESERPCILNASVRGRVSSSRKRFWTLPNLYLEVSKTKILLFSYWSFMQIGWRETLDTSEP